MASSSSSSKTTTYIPLHKTQLPPRMHSPFSPSPTNPNNPTHHKRLLLIISLSLLPFLIYFLSLSSSLHLPSSSTFGLIIEIADSHSQISVFKSLNEISGTPFSGESSDSMWAHPGLSGSKPGDVGRALNKLVGFAKGKVPSSEWKVTKVQVLVTGGGNGLDDGDDERDGVLDECKKVLRSSGFLFRDDWASILRGQDEGLYNWVAVNYALGYIGNEPQETAGVIVLGQSAMQVSYASNESPPSKFSRVIRLAGVSYNLYTQSLQEFGQDAVWNVLHEQAQDLTSSTQNNPCIPRGYELTSAGNFTTCKSLLMTLLNERQGRCAHPPCELASSIPKELERKPHPQQRFFLSSQFQGLVPKASVSGLETVGHQYCEDGWENLKRQYDTDDRDLSRSCFSHALMAILLHNNFGIPFDDKRVEFAAGSTPVDWRLGAFLSQSIMDPLEKEVEHHETQVVGNESISYFLLFAILLVFVLLAAFFVMKLRKPQFKTIYDLEKGRYIVTRIPR